MTSYDSDWLDRAYNNRALVPEHPAFLARWAEDSARTRTSERCTLDVPYGEGAGERLDIFPTDAPNAPVLVFFHGGFWRALDKSDHSCLAPPFTRQGVCVVLPNYALCPGTEEEPVTIPHIVRQAVRALAWVWRHIAEHGGDPARITVAGHSAGGHLAAMLAACDWAAAGLPAVPLRNALSLSGLYELEPIRHTPHLQAVLRLTPEDAAMASPAWLPAPAGVELHAVVGADESLEFLRHNQLIASAWGRHAVPVCEVAPGLHHFSIVDAFAEPGHAVHRMATRLLGVDGSLRAVAESLLERTLQPEDGVADEALQAARQRLGAPLPAPLAEFHRLVGRVPMFVEAFQRLWVPQDLEIDGGKLVFAEENQGVCRWGCQAEEGDPPALQQPAGQARWYPEDVPLSQFLAILMYYQCAQGGYPHAACVAPEDRARVLAELATRWRKVVDHHGLVIYQQPGVLAWHFADKAGRPRKGDTLFVVTRTEARMNALAERYPLLDLG